MKPIRVLFADTLVAALYVRVFPRRSYPHWLDCRRIGRLLVEAVTN